MTKFYNWLNEGGGYGHLSNIFDNVYFTFGDLKDVIKDSLSGNLEYIRLKTDGQNLMFTWKNNQMLFARNKGHLKNFGSNAMTFKDLSSKFSGRGDLSIAYEAAAKDLYTAISKLSDSQKEKIFANGKKFMSVEVMYIKNENIIHYGVNELRFHGTKEYDINGKEIGDNKNDGNILAGMIKQIRQNKQGTYNIKSLEKVNLPKVPDFDNQVKRLIKILEDIKGKFSLSDSATILEYKQAYFKDLMKKKGIPFNKLLLKRWSESDKSYKLTQIKNDFTSEEFEKIQKMENDINLYIKDSTLPLEKLILDLGATVLNNVSNFMVLHPQKSKEVIQKKLENAIKEIKSKGTPEMINKLKMELDRLNSAGGINKIFPEEGITFIYKGGFYKLTGTFAPLNQIINMLWQLK